MFPRVFPIGIGIGTDICRVSRIYKNLTSPMATKFVQRILTPEELDTPGVSRILKKVFTPEGFMPRSPDLLSNTENAARNPKQRDPRLWKAAEFMAGRFAAKEATVKAYSLRRLSFHDIVVTYEHDLPAEPPENGDVSGSSPNAAGDDAPPNEYQSSPPVAIIKGEGGHENVYARLSISHDGDYAIAMCLATLDGPSRSES
ncbi:hypothetical protein F4819DRAFT_324358 [Hypoxylon fuscum]|nr:hypothetical protein F4819DRAFT_324358 [Hypoxylon fuscum]